jgi:hypothetical protein
MPTDPPIACSLTAVEMPVRLAEMAAVGRSALLDVETAGASAALRFRPGARTRRRLEAIVAAESDCCRFLKMALTEDRDALLLAITAPPGGEPVLEELVGAFSATEQAA